MKYIPFGPYVLKCLWRNRSRTLLTVGGSAVAIFVYSCVGSIQGGLARLTQDQKTLRTLIVFQENRFCPASSLLPEDYARAVSKMPGVREVVPIKVFTNNCRASLDVVVFHGMRPIQLRSARELTLVAGAWDQFDERKDAAVVGQSVAQRRNLAPGSRFTIGDISVHVVGIARSKTPAEDHYIYTHLDFLQRAQGKDEVGTVTQLEVLVDPTTDPDRLAADIDARFQGGPVATSTRSKGVFQRETLSDLAEFIGFAHWLGYACVGLVLALVATTTVMAVQDRIQEHAVLRTLGLRPGRVFRLILAESMLQSLAGGILGVGAGLLLLAWGRFAIAAEGVTIAFQPSLTLAATGILIATAVGLVAGLAPGWQAARMEIVKAMRQA